MRVQPYGEVDDSHGRFISMECPVTVTPVTGRARSKRTVATIDFPGWCARPACRKEFRRTVGATGRPSDYCSAECQRLVHAERKAVAARVKRLEEMLRQARTDLDGFNAHDLDKPLGSASHQRVEVALGKAGTALKYISGDTPGVPELAELVDAVTALASEARTNEDVA
jgi:hypothetical protein